MTAEYFLDHEIYYHEYISGQRFVDICHLTKGVHFDKIDLLDNLTRSCNVLVTHNSDWPLDEKCFLRHASKVNVRWFAQNQEYQHEKTEAIPIGLNNFRLGHNKDNFQEWPEALEFNRYIDQTAREKRDKDGLILLNFNDATDRRSNERSDLRDEHTCNKWITQTPHDPSLWREYYRDLARHKFVFSPRGNGVDCVRTWEALYLRTIPVMMRSTAMEAFNDLPIIFVTHWNQVTPSFLEERYEEIVNRKYDLSKMRIGWWANRIKHFAKQGENNG